MALPFVPKIAKKIPIVQYINGKIAASVSNKLATSNWQALNRLDARIFKETTKHLPFIKTEVNKYVRARIQNQVNLALRNKNTYRTFIGKYGKSGAKIMILLRYGTPNTILNISKALLPFATFFGSFTIMKSKYDELWATHPEWQKELDANTVANADIQKMEVVGDTTIYNYTDVESYAEDDPYANE